MLYRIWFLETTNIQFTFVRTFGIVWSESVDFLLILYEIHIASLWGCLQISYFGLHWYSIVLMNFGGLYLCLKEKRGVLCINQLLSVKINWIYVVLFFCVIKFFFLAIPTDWVEFLIQYPFLSNRHSVCSIFLLKCSISSVFEQESYRSLSLFGVLFEFYSE